MNQVLRILTALLMFHISHFKLSPDLAKQLKQMTDMLCNLEIKRLLETRKGELSELETRGNWDKIKANIVVKAMEECDKVMGDMDNIQKMATADKNSNPMDSFLAAMKSIDFNKIANKSDLSLTSEQQEVYNNYVKSEENAGRRGRVPPKEEVAEENDANEEEDVSEDANEEEKVSDDATAEKEQSEL